MHQSSKEGQGGKESIKNIYSANIFSAFPQKKSLHKMDKKAFFRPKNIKASVF